MKVPNSNKLLLYCAGIIIQCCLISVGFCATYYVDATAANDSGNGSITSPKKYISSGTALMSGGDTLIIRNGLYSNAKDVINGTSIRNGTSGAYTTIKAENIGQVQVSTMEGLNIPSSAQYITVQGIHFSGAYSKIISGNHLKFLDCGFQGGPAIDNQVNTATNGSYILFEGCYFYGLGGRYNLIMYNANHVVVRRCVIRHDGGWSDTKGDPEAATNNYSSDYIYYQNTIVIDSDQSYHNWYGAFYSTQDAANSNAGWNGCIVLNTTQGHYAIDPKSGGSLASFSLKNVIGYGDGYFSVSFGGNGSDSGTLTNFTFGSSTYGLGKWNNGTVTAKNGILFNLSGDPIIGVTTSYTDIEGGGVTCGNCQTYDPQTNGLMYLPRIETASNLASQGESGGRMGAQVLCKVGKDGTLYGETDWNTEYTCSLTGGGGGSAANNLWPFRNEAIIKSKFAAVSARGFATGTSKDGSSQTLTKYIWEYLGNKIPAEIYASQPPINEPPSAPENLHVVQ